MNLTIVLPVYNEVDNLKSVTAKLNTWRETSQPNLQVVMVDDGSSDGSYELLDKLSDAYSWVQVIHNDDNLGYGGAVKAGLDMVTTEWMGFMDSDDQFEPSDFELLIAHAAQNNAVAGYRERRADPFKRKVFAWGYGTLSKLILGVKHRDINCAMKIMKTELWPSIRPQISMGGIFNAEMLYRCRKAGVRWYQVAVPHYPRQFGEQTGGSIKVVVLAIWELIKLRLSKNI